MFQSYVFFSFNFCDNDIFNKIIFVSSASMSLSCGEFKSSNSLLWSSRGESICTEPSSAYALLFDWPKMENWRNEEFYTQVDGYVS